MTTRFVTALTILLSVFSCSSQDVIINIAKDYSVRKALIFKMGVVFQDTKTNRILYADQRSHSTIVAPAKTVLDIDIQKDTLVYLTKMADTIEVSRFNLAKRSAIGLNRIIVSGIAGFPMVIDTLLAIPLKDSILFVSTETNLVVHLMSRESAGNLHEIGLLEDGTLCLLTDVANAPKLRLFGFRGNLLVGPFQFIASTEYFSACLFKKTVFLSDVGSDSTRVRMFTEADLGGLNIHTILGRYLLMQTTAGELLLYCPGTFVRYSYQLNRLGIRHK